MEAAQMQKGSAQKTIRMVALFGHYKRGTVPSVKGLKPKDWNTWKAKTEAVAY